MRSRGCKIAGFSIIELLVGIAIGLIIVVTATIMYTDILKSQKDITDSARLNQELGAVMTIMSNEIRRAGFRMCDASIYDCKINPENVEIPFMPGKYAYADVIKIGDGGKCIEYRYNANRDVSDDNAEQMGFRLKNEKIEMAKAAANVVCGSDTNWVPLTDPEVIKVTSLNFKTTGSKCRNMEESKNWYWVVGDGATGLACDITSPITCTPLTTGVASCGTPLLETDDYIFGMHQIVIELNANLSRDPTVAKHMETSVKVENPWAGTVP